METAPREERDPREAWPVQLAAATLAILGLVAATALFIDAYATRRDARAVVKPASLDEDQRRGRVVFLGRCQECHPDGGAGRGPSLIHKPLPRAAVHAWVRAGPGVMPAFSEEALADEEIDALFEYLVALRRAQPPSGAR